MEELINLIKKNNIKIIDISTDDGDLEDVFLKTNKKLDYLLINSNFNE